MEDNKRKLYDALSAEYDLGTFEQFSTDIQDADKRKKLYDATINDYDFGDYDSFSSQLGFSPAQEVDKSQYTFTGEQFGKGGLLNQSAEEYMTDVQKNIDSRKVGMDFEKLRQEKGINAGRSNVVKKEGRYYTEAGSFDNYSQAAYDADKQDLESNIKSMIDLYKNREGKEWENYERARNLGLAARGFKFDTPEGLKAADRLRGYLRVMPHEAIKALGKDGYEALKFYDNKIREFGEKDAEVRADAERLDEEGTVLQGFEGLGRGMEYVAGETLNVFTGSALDDKEILENWDEFFKDGKLKSPQEMGFRGANEMANRHINYAANFPPVYKDYQAYLAKLLQENNNDVEKVKGIIKERSNDSTLGDWLKTDAAEAINDFKPTAEGVGGFLAEMIPNMAGTLLAIGVGALTKNPTAVKMIGYANLASMSASTAGNSMKEARDAGATNGQVWATGIADGAIEFITEKIPYDKLTGSMFRQGKKGMAAGLRRAVDTPEGQRELSELLNLAQKELGVDIFNRATAKNYLSNVAAEGLSEFSAEALQTMTKAIYASPEEYPTLWEAVQNGWEGMKGGLFMGAVLGGYATVSKAGMHDARRRKQGFVRVAQAEIGGVPVIGEILEEKKDGSLVFMYNGEEKTINKKDVKQEYEFTYDEFRTSELGNIVNNAYEEGYSQEPTGVNAMGTVLGYNQARMDVVRALGLAEDADVDAFLNGRSAEEVALGDADVENTIVNYQMQKARKEGLQERFQQTRAKQYEESDRSIDKIANNGVVYSTTINGEQVYITGGTVVLDEQGFIDVNSSNNLFCLMPDGTKKPKSENELREKISMQNAEDLKAAKRAEINDRWRAEFDTAEAQAIEQEKREAGTVFDKADHMGVHRIEILNEGEQMSDILIDGKQEQIPTEELNRWKQEAGIQSTDAVADDTTDNVAPTGDNVAPVAPVEMPDVPDFFRLNGKNYEVVSRNADGSVDVVIDGKRETLPAGTDYSTSMPTDKKGDVQYEQMPVERTHEHFMQKVTDDESRALMIEGRRKKAEAERKKFDKKPDPGLDPDKWAEVNRKWEEGKKAAQAKVDYWNEVAKREAEITRSETREAVENIKPDVVKETAEEFIAGHLPKITPESFKRETGLSNEEQSKLVGVISNEGVTIEQAAESIMENYDSELKALGFTGDMQDVRNVIIDVLSQGNPRSYAKNSREAREAENIEQQRAEAEAWAMGTFNMTLEELYVYEETLLPRLTREFEGFDYNEYYNNLAGNYENDTTRESESIGRGGEVLQGEQSVPASGAPAVGVRNEGGAVSNDVQGGGQNGVAQEEAINEPVGNSDQLSSSEIPNNQSVAEGDAPGQGGVQEITNDERVEMEARIVDWLSEDNLERASGKTRDEIFDEFGNELEPIAYIPTQYISLVSQDLKDQRIYCGKGYFIDHALRNHAKGGKQLNAEDVDVSKYLNIQSVLDNPDSVKETYVDGKRTVVFIKKIGKYFAELTQVEEDGKIVLHKSMFDQKKEPYAKLDDIRSKGTSSEGGVSSISHTAEAAPAISLESRGDVVLNSTESSANEDRNSVSNSQENTQKSGEIAENGGEKKSSIIEEAEAEYRNNPLHGVQFSIDADAYNNEDVTFGESEQSTEGGALVSYQDVIYKGQTIGWVKETQSGRMFAPMVTSFYVPLENATEEDKRSPHYFEGEEDYMRFATLQQMVDYINSRPQQGEIQEPRSVEEDLDNGDKRITNYNSRGEVATVAIERDGKIVSVDSYDEGVLFEHTEYDSKGKATSVTRYDREGNVISTQRYVNGKRAIPTTPQEFADEAKARAEEKRRIPLRERARELETQVGVKANIIESLDEVKNREARKRIAEGEAVAGWYSGGQVYLYMPNIKDRREIELTYVHEVVAHHGVKKLLGERFNEFLDGVWNMMSEADRARMLAYVGVKENATLQDMRAAADEYVAELAEKMNLGELEQSTWDKIVDWFKELLEKAGFENLTKEDIESMLKASYANLAKGENDAQIKDRTMFRIADSERRQEKKRINDAIDTAAGFVTVGGKKQATKNRLKKEAERKQLAKEMYSSVLKGDFNDVTLAQIDKFIEDATPANPFGRRISQRLPQRMERALRQGARTNAVDALFSRISESAVPANERFSEAGRREIEERKKELLKGWAIATGNWHTDLKEFTDDTEPIGEGKDSKVYSSKDGRYVIKASKGKPYGKRFRPDIDNIALFNDVFRDTRYEILGYGEIDGEFVRILQQPIVDFAQSAPLTSEERREYMQSLGFEPLNDANTAFADGEIVIADLQKGNVVRDAAGNISVIDADAKQHTKDVGGDYTYPPVEEDLPENSGTRFRIANENQEIFVSNAQRAIEGIQQNKATAEQWIAMLKKNGGLKAGEDAWLGLEEWLNEKQGAVTKQEILDFIAQNRIQIEEVEYEDLGKSIDYELAAVEGNLERARRDLAYEEAQVSIAEKWLQDSQEEYDSFLSTANRLKTEYGENSPEYRNYIFYDSYTDVLANAKRALENAKSDVEYRRQQIAELEKAVKEKQNQKTRGINRTRLDYTTVGLENKREIALVVPTIESWNASDEIHFGDAGNGRAVAWVRFGETTDSEGNRVLVIDEIQSKRHQEGREKGYGRATSEDVKSALEAVNAAQSEFDEYNAEMAKKYGSEYDWNIDATDAEIDKWQELYDKVAQLGQVYEDVAESNRKGIPSAPFEKNWHELAMKRMLRLAAEEGFDKVAWTTGEQQAQRYNLSNSVSRIDVELDGRKTPKNTNLYDVYTYDTQGDVIDAASGPMNEERLSEVFGKEIAISIAEGVQNSANGKTSISGDGLRIGGEGMKGFYDKMLPSFVQKYTKKWGAEVGEVTMPNLSENNTMWSVDVTPEMQESVMQGQTMFRFIGEKGAANLDRAERVINEFNKAHKGATKKVVVSKGKETLVQQMRDAGFTDFSIEVALKNYEGEENPTDGAYYVSSDGIVIYDTENLDITLWHENTHRAIRKIFDGDLSELQRVYNELPDGVKEDIANKLKAKSYSEEDFPEESVCYFVEEMYKNGLLDNKYNLVHIVEQTDPQMKDFANFAQKLINYINNGRKEFAREGEEFTEEFHIKQQLPERNSGSDKNGEGIDEAAGGEEETRFRREVEEAIEQQEENEVSIARETVTSLGEKLNSPVKIIDDLESVPENRRKWKGWFDPKTGEVVVVMPNHVSTEDAVQTVLHETVAHKGLRAVLGEKFDEFLDGVYKDASQKVKRGINDKFLNALKNGSALTVREATEEYIAELAERDFEGYRDTWNAIRQWFRNFFRNFMNMEITDGELRYLLWKNYNRMKSGPIEIILDRAMEANTGTGKVMARTAETFSTVDSYNKNVKGFKNKVKEGWYDSLRSLKKAQEAIEKTLDREIDDSSNVYLYANHIPSINKNKMEVFSMRLIRPFADFLESVYKKNKDIDEKTLERYANAKHGIERNREMSVKAAMTEVQDDKKVFNDTAYREWQEKKKVILANGESWMEQQDKLDALARTYGAKIRDFSGLTAIFDPERKLKYRNIRKAAIDFINSIEQKIDSKKLWEHINGINDYSLRESYESGIISKAQYESISSMYDFYVPLRGHSEMTSDEYYDYITTDHSALSSVVKRAEGRKSEADNIFATMLNMANSAIVYGSKNRLKQRLLNLAMIHSTPLLSVDNAWYEKKDEEYVPAYPDITENMTDEERVAEYARFDEEMKEKEKLGLASRHRPGLNLKYKSVDNWKKQQHAVHVKRNGTEYIVWVNGEPAMANAINGLNLDNDAGGLFEYAQGFNRFRARMVTQYSPEFVLTNGARDIQSSSLVYAVRHGAAAAGRFIKNVAANAKRMGKLYKKYRKGTLDMNNEVERYFKEFLENGGETGYTEMFSIDDYKKKMEKMTKGLNIKNATGRAFATMGEGVERANRCVENLCRFSAYLTSRKAGISILKSIEDAKEVSVNFNRKGSGAMGQKYFKALTMFLNPAIQAAAQRIILASKTPKRMYPVLLAEFMLGASNSLLYNMLVSLLYEDDDEENNYYNLTPYRRRSSFILPFMNGVINIPLAHESRVFFGLGEIFTSVLTGHLKLSDVPLEAYKSIAQALPLNPMDGWDPGDDLLGALAANALGDISRPVAEIMRNKDFAGNRIHNRTDFTEHLPERLRGKRGTAVLYNWISDILSGDYEKNWMDENFGTIINPSILEHLAQSIFGGLYTTGENIIKTGMWIFGDEEYAEVRNIPFVRSFYTSFDKYEGWEADGRAARDWETAYKYYADEIKRMSDTEKTAKMLEKQGDKGAKEKLKEMEVDGDLLRIDILNDGQKKLKELYEESNEARTAKDMDAVKDVNKRIYELKKSMVERMEMMIDNPAIGYTFLTNKTEGPYEERETYGDVRDVNVINDFQKELKPIIEEREKSADKDKYQKQYDLWKDLKRAEEWVSNQKSGMKKEPEKADELMTKIREKRAEAIELINNYRNNE